MNKNAKIAKQLIKLAKELVAEKNIQADLLSTSGINAFLAAIEKYPDTTEGNQALHTYIRQVVDALFNARNGLQSTYDSYLAKKRIRATELHDMFYQQLTQGFRKKGQGKNSEIITVKDINDLSRNALSEFRNLLGFQLVQPGMFPSLDETQSTNTLEKMVKMPSLMQNPNDSADIIQNPNETDDGTQYLNLPYQLLQQTGATAAFDLFVTRMSRDIDPNTMDNKFVLVSSDELDKIGSKLYIALGKQPTLLADFRRNMTQKSLLNKLLQGKAEIEAALTISLRSLVGIIVNNNEQISLYDTSVKEEIANIAKKTQEQQALIEEKRQQQLKNPSLLKKQREMPEDVMYDDTIRKNREQDNTDDDGGFRMSSEERKAMLIRRHRAFEASVKTAGLGEWWNGFKNKVKGLWHTLKDAFASLKETVSNCIESFTKSSEDLKQAVANCEEEYKRVEDRYAEQAAAFNELVKELEQACDGAKK